MVIRVQVCRFFAKRAVDLHATDMGRDGIDDCYRDFVLHIEHFVEPEVELFSPYDPARFDIAELNGKSDAFAGAPNAPTEEILDAKPLTNLQRISFLLPKSQGGSACNNEKLGYVA